MRLYVPLRKTDAAIRSTIKRPARIKWRGHGDTLLFYFHQPRVEAGWMIGTQWSGSRFIGSDGHADIRTVDLEFRVVFLHPARFVNPIFMKKPHEIFLVRLKVFC